MNKKLIVSIMTVLAVIVLGAGYMLTQNNGQESSQGVSGQEQHGGSPFTNPAEDQSTDEVQSGTVSMDIEGFAFAQKTLKIKPGTTVTWTNQDEAKHDVNPDNESPHFKAGPLLAQGESYSYTFNEPGTYTYHCTPHPYMKASVEVVE